MIYDSVIIGGGPAGLACSIELQKNNKKVLLIEREPRLGGILKQCIHSGFGVERFQESLTGPEYAEKFIEEFMNLGIEYLTSAFVTKALKNEETNNFHLDVITQNGMIVIETKTLVLSTGCRERTGKQVFLPGTRPYGVMTAGTCQALININGIIPGTKAVILGSGDIGLIMARRLALSGVEVEGVYEIKDSPSGLARNVHQCLNDYNIPLHLSTTVNGVYGTDRLEGVSVQEVDNHNHFVDNTRRDIKCDLLILSVGLIPENELAESLGVNIDLNTHGAQADNIFETNVPGVFTCGNATHVNDLVDYVSESAEICARGVIETLDKELLSKKNTKLPISCFGKALYVVPQALNYSTDLSQVVMYYRPKHFMALAEVKVMLDGRVLYQEKVRAITPTQMKRIEIDFSKARATSFITFRIDELRDRE